MNEALEKYISGIDYGDTAERCIAWIRDWFAVNGPSSPAVIGISGGKDSSIVAALCVKALGAGRVFGVLMPNSVQPDIYMSNMLVEHLNIKSAEINVSGGVEAVKASIASAGIDPSAQMNINLPPRIRMATLYAVSQCINGRVANTCNRSENYVGYSTIFGDAAGDFSPLGMLTVTEVRKVGSAVGLPSVFIEKAPSDGLTNKTDEDNLGFTYEDLDTLILTGTCSDEKLREKIEKRHRANLFKLKPMPEFIP